MNADLPPMETADGTLMRTLKARDQKRRKKLRAKLRAEGASEQLIEKIIEQERYAQLVKRHGAEEARRIIIDQTSKEPNDSGYRPSAGDPLLRGPARVNGLAAKVVRRRNTITRFQYDGLALTEETKESASKKR